MKVRRANKLYRASVRKDFEGKNVSQSMQLLIRQTTVYELKHKWDETLDTSRTWVNLDLEVSAHLAEIRYGRCPQYAMMDYINRLQTFYLHNNYSSVHNKLKPVILDGWRMVELIQGAADANEQLIEYAKKNIFNLHNT